VEAVGFDRRLRSYRYFPSDPVAVYVTRAAPAPHREGTLLRAGIAGGGVSNGNRDGVEVGSEDGRGVGDGDGNGSGAGDGNGGEDTTLDDSIEASGGADDAVAPVGAATCAAVPPGQTFLPILEEFLLTHPDGPRRALKIPTFYSAPLDMQLLFSEVRARGGHERVTAAKQWKRVCGVLGHDPSKQTSAGQKMRTHYEKWLLDFERHLGSAGVVGQAGRGEGAGGSEGEKEAAGGGGGGGADACSSGDGAVASLAREATIQPKRTTGGPRPGAPTAPVEMGKS
jgi:hypothetical protein